MNDELLIKTIELRRVFGGLAANDRVSIELRRGQVHALLGPNGAGKSTLINLLSGDIKATSGQVLYRGQDITALSPHERSHIGIGRSYQKTNIFPGFSVRENCRLAAQSREPRAGRIFSDATQWAPYRQAVDEALQRTDLSDVAEQRAGELSHGQQRQLELAIVLATRPQVLLLDEPLAGLSAQERQTITALLRGIDKAITIIMIEHDMEVALALADRITLLHHGEVITAGTRQEVVADPRTREIYLGQTPPSQIKEAEGPSGGSEQRARGGRHD